MHFIGLLHGGKSAYDWWRKKRLTTWSGCRWQISSKRKICQKRPKRPKRTKRPKISQSLFAHSSIPSSSSLFLDTSRPFTSQFQLEKSSKTVVPNVRIIKWYARKFKFMNRTYIYYCVRRLIGSLWADTKAITITEWFK